MAHDDPHDGGDGPHPDGRGGEDARVAAAVADPVTLALARRLMPERGGGIDSITISTSGMHGRAVTLTAEDGERFDRRQRGGARVIDEGTGEVRGGDDPDAAFWVPERWDFVDPRYIEEGGNRFSDNAPVLDYLPAPSLAAVAGVLLDRYRSEFHHLFPPFKQKVDYLWKRQGGESAGRATLGMCVKVGTLAKHYASLTIPDATWAIWLAADNCALITNRQIRGLLLHELCHTGMNDKLKPKMVGHDVEEFRFVIEEFGFIFDDLRQLKASVLQRSLFEGDERQQESE